MNAGTACAEPVGVTVRSDRTRPDQSPLTQSQIDALASINDGLWHDATEEAFRHLTRVEYIELLDRSLIEVRRPHTVMSVATVRIAENVPVLSSPGTLRAVPPRQREEVLNVVLAERLSARGIAASPETITAGHAMPDVIVVFHGLRCAIEGKTGDVGHARQLVSQDALGRVEEGIAQLAIGVVYPRHLRSTSFAALPAAMDAAVLEFFVQTELGAGDWRTGGVDALGEELRRAHDGMVRDDVVVRAVSKIRFGMDAVASILIPEPAICDRLIAVLGIGEPSSGDSAEN